MAIRICFAAPFQQCKNSGYKSGGTATESRGQITTILVDKKRYDVQCYGEDKIAMFGIKNAVFANPLNPQPDGKAPKGFYFFLISLLIDG